MDGLFALVGYIAGLCHGWMWGVLWEGRSKCKRIVAPVENNLIGSEWIIAYTDKDRRIKSITIATSLPAGKYEFFETTMYGENVLIMKRVS